MDYFSVRHNRIVFKEIKIKIVKNIFRIIKHTFELKWQKLMAFSTQKKTIIKSPNFFPLFIAAIVGILFALPHMYGLWKFGNDYQPLISSPHLSYMSEENYTYAPEVHQILKGHWRGDQYLWEYRSSPSPYVNELASILPILPLSILGGSIPNGFIFSDLIFPAILFFIIFLALASQGINRATSIAASLGVVIIPFLSMLFPRLSSYGTLLTGTTNAPLFFSRTPHPQISTIYLFLVLFLTVWILRRPSTKAFLLWSVIVALSMYSSIYIASTIFLGTLLLLVKIIKKISPKKIFLGFSIALLILTPWMINFYQQQSLFTDSDFLYRFTFPKDFLFPAQLRYLAFGLLLFKLRKDNLSRVILSYAIAASLLLDTHQIILNRNIQADHWLSRVLAPLSTLSIFLIAKEFISRFIPHFRWVIIIWAIFLIGFTAQINWIRAHSEYFQENLDRREIINLISSQTKKNDVIGTFSSDLNDEIVGITGRYIYIAPGDRSPVRLEEQLRRICDLAILSKEKNIDQNIREAVAYSLALAVIDIKLVKNSENQVKKCIEKSPSKPAFRIDYLVEKDDHSHWHLTKLKK